MRYEKIELVKASKTAYVRLNQPNKHNAFDAQMIAELRHCFKYLKHSQDCHFVVLSGKGQNFCAGADLDWMRQMADGTYDENVKDAQQLAKLFYQIAHFPKPIITLVQGAAFGGGVGLVACSDIVVASSDAVFALSEVKLGLTPATISP